MHNHKPTGFKLRTLFGCHGYVIRPEWGLLVVGCNLLNCWIQLNLFNCSQHSALSSEPRASCADCLYLLAPSLDRRVFTVCSRASRSARPGNKQSCKTVRSTSWTPLCIGIQYCGMTKSHFFKHFKWWLLLLWMTADLGQKKTPNKLMVI